MILSAILFSIGAILISLVVNNMFGIACTTYWAAHRGDHDSYSINNSLNAALMSVGVISIYLSQVI